MLTFRFGRCVRVAALIALCCIFSAVASAQQSGSSKMNTAAADSATGAAAEAAAKNKIINSPEWKQAQDDFQRWINSQAIYSPADIERITATMIGQIQDMPTSELQGFLDDWQARLKVLGGKDSQE